MENQEKDFVIASEKIVKLLETMAMRGLTNPIAPKYEWSHEDIEVSLEEKRDIGIYVLTFRNILSKSGIKPIGSMFGDKDSFTFPTSVKLQCLATDRTSASYCTTLMQEIEEAVAEYIKTAIEY